jgi:hypothetical protein
VTAVTNAPRAVVSFSTDTFAGRAETVPIANRGCSFMDDQQRQALVEEIEHHRARIAELLLALLDIEENMKHVLDAPPELSRKADLLRLELRGRRAAFTIGSAHLSAYSPG